MKKYIIGNNKSSVVIFECDEFIGFCFELINLLNPEYLLSCISYNNNDEKVYMYKMGGLNEISYHFVFSIHIINNKQLW